jgi:hypothetical protein
MAYVETASALIKTGFIISRDSKGLPARRHRKVKSICSIKLRTVCDALMSLVTENEDLDRPSPAVPLTDRCVTRHISPWRWTYREYPERWIQTQFSHERSQEKLQCIKISFNSFFLILPTWRQKRKRRPLPLQIHHIPEIWHICTEVNLYFILFLFDEPTV